MTVQRLVNEFQAQDVGAFMVVRIEHETRKVASWSDENNIWLMMPAGQALLDEKDGVVVESPTADVKEKATRRGPRPKGLSGIGSEE